MPDVTAALHFPPFRIPANIDLLYRDDEVVALERRAVRVLRYLAAHSDRVVTKEELLEAVWPDTFTTDGVLKRAISQARRALGDAADEARFIQTFHGQGYQFIAPLQSASSAVPPAATATLTPPPTLSIPPTLPAPASIFNAVPDYNQLVGRDAELALLQSEYQRALAGRSQPVLLFGEPGLGKTQLGRAFANWVREQGALCLYAQFFDYQASRRAPYEIFLDLLRSVLGTGATGNLAQRDQLDLRALAQSQLNVALPEELFSDLNADPRASATTGKLSVTAGLRESARTGALALRRATGALGSVSGNAQSTMVTRAVAPLSQCFLRASRQRPLVLLLDDLQWADEASREVIGYLMRSLQREPLLLVGLARSEALETTANNQPHPLAEWLKRQASQRSYSSHTLRPLNAEGCRAAIEAVFGCSAQALNLPAHDLQTLVRITGGNPYFLTEMLRLLVAEGVIGLAPAPQSGWLWRGIKDLTLPVTIVMAAQAKLDRLSDEVRELAECAAVLGDEFRVETLAQTTRHSEEEIEQFLRAAVRHGVLSERGVTAGNDARFYHTTLRQVLYEGLSPRRRKRLHLQAAQAIETVYQTEPERVADALSAHYEAAGDFTRAFDWSLRAWQAAANRLAWSEAVISLARAQRVAENLNAAGARLNDGDRLRLLLAAGEAGYAVGKLQESETAYQEASQLARRLNDQATLALTLLQLGETRTALGHYREAAAVTGQALELQRALHDEEGAALALLQLGSIEVRLGNYETAAELAQQARAGAAHNSELEASACGLLGWARALQGRFAEGVSLLEQAVDHINGSNGEQRRVLLLRRTHWAELSRGRYEAALKLAVRARDEARRIGDATGEAQMTMGIGQVRVAQGLYAEGIELLTQARAALRTVGDAHTEAEAAWLLGRAHCESGNLDEARALLETALTTVREVGDRDDEFRVLTDLARLRLAANDAPGALEHARAAVQLAEALHNRDGLGLALIELARALAATDEPKEAHAAIEQALALLEGTASGERWRGYWAQAQLLMAAKQTSAALEVMRQCVALLADTRRQLDDNDQARRAAITQARRGPARALHQLLLAQQLHDEAGEVARAWQLSSAG